MNQLTMLDAARQALSDALVDPSVLVLGQLVRYGLGGLTTGLYDKHPTQLLTMPTCENLMHAAAMGLSLAGKRPVVINERMDFLALAMDPLLNHIPIWQKRAPLDLPLVVVAVVGKGHGQGPQHSKNFTRWFERYEGWVVVEPYSPKSAHAGLLSSIFFPRPVLYVLHREFFGATESVVLPYSDRVELCGASPSHERDFYARK